MSAHRLIADLNIADSENSEGRPVIEVGLGAPTASNRGLVYINDSPAASPRFYLWNGSAYVAVDEAAVVAANVAELDATVSETYDDSELQAVYDKVDELIGALVTAGIMADS